MKAITTRWYGNCGEATHYRSWCAGSSMHNSPWRCDCIHIMAEEDIFLYVCLSVLPVVDYKKKVSVYTLELAKKLGLRALKFKAPIRLEPPSLLTEVHQFTPYLQIIPNNTSSDILLLFMITFLSFTFSSSYLHFLCPCTLLYLWVFVLKQICLHRYIVSLVNV